MAKSKPKPTPSTGKFDGIFNFFTKFSPLIAIGALVLSVINFVDTGNKWDELNNANIVLTDLKTAATGTISLDSIGKMDFGIHNPLYGPSGSNDKVNIYHYLVPYDSTNRRINLPIKPITSSSAQSALKMLGKSGDFQLHKAIEFDVFYKNIGKTVAKDCVISIAFLGAEFNQVKEPDIDYNDTTKFLHPSDFVSMLKGEFEFQTNAILPEFIKFKVHISFTTINGKRISRDEIYTWHKSTVTFSQEE